MARNRATENSRWTEADARAVIEEWAASGKPIRAFAGQRQLAPQRLYRWRKRIERKSGPAPTGFVPLTVRSIDPAAALGALVKIGDLRIEVRQLDEASAAWLASLVRSLRGNR